ncbi:MAG: type IV pilus modification protein PilV, partial [Proteobacteria bacterium]|nr:type IV pilus modification protein PilV [Pseudomonadota bacterium]
MRAMTNPSPLRRFQAGVGMLEVMIAVLVLAIGILGIAALQAVTLKNAGSSAERTQASIHMYEMGDLLRANRSRLTDFQTGGYMCLA